MLYYFLLYCSPAFPWMCYFFFSCNREMQIAVKLHYFSPTMLFSSFHYDLFALEICRIHYFFCKLFFSFFSNAWAWKGLAFLLCGWFFVSTSGCIRFRIQGEPLSIILCRLNTIHHHQPKFGKNPIDWNTRKIVTHITHWEKGFEERFTVETHRKIQHRTGCQKSGLSSMENGRLVPHRLAWTGNWEIFRAAFQTFPPLLSLTLVLTALKHSSV